MASHETMPLQPFPNYSSEDLARLCFTSLRNARRWKQSKRVPQLVYAYLELLRGRVELIHRDWCGWLINDRGELCTPDNDVFKPSHIVAMPMVYASLRDRQREVRELKERLQQLLSELKTAQAALTQPATVTLTMQLPAALARLDSLAALREAISFLDSPATCASA